VQVSYRGEACVVGFGPDYTFEQLKCDAAGRWCLDPGLLVLTDADRFNFPPSERVEPWISTLRDNTIYVTHLNAPAKGAAAGALQSSQHALSQSHSQLPQPQPASGGALSASSSMASMHQASSASASNLHGGFASSSGAASASHAARPLANRTASSELAPLSSTGTTGMTSSLTIAGAAHTTAATANFPLSGMWSHEATTTS
jgi:hypothetical protein